MTILTVSTLVANALSIALSLYAISKLKTVTKAVGQVKEAAKDAKHAVTDIIKKV